MDIQDIKARLSLTTVLNHYHLKPDRNHRREAGTEHLREPERLRLAQPVRYGEAHSGARIEGLRGRPQGSVHPQGRPHD